MNSKQFSMPKGLLALSALVLSSVAHANGTITFTGTASIPTMSEWGMVIMAFLLAGFAIRTLHKSKHSRATPLAVLIGTFVFAVAMSGDGMLARAVQSIIQVSCNTSGVYSLLNNSEHQFNNTSGGNLTVSNMSGTNIAESNPCTLNMVLTNGQSCNCQIDTYTPPSQ